MNNGLDPGKAKSQDVQDERVYGHECGKHQVSCGGGASFAAVSGVGGLEPNGRYQILLNGAPIGSGSTNATPDGTLTLSATLSDEPQTLRVVEGSGATILMIR